MWAPYEIDFVSNKTVLYTWLPTVVTEYPVELKKKKRSTQYFIKTFVQLYIYIMFTIDNILFSVWALGRKIFLLGVKKAF